jgi:tRNA(fMet)-specific endonuclease VapC
MSTQYLLDANILTNMARNPFGASSHILKNVGSANAFTSVIVAGEIQFGIEKFSAFRLRRQMELILDTIDIHPLPLETIETYSVLRTQLELKGQLIGSNDMWIAAHALAEDAVLVTNNIREFSRIKDLKVENWMQSA